ncbi:PAS domain-containing protein [Rhizobium sp. XQZ8]|uniref:sensor histidine kinase n=1 Tax=Rhizobium populisoli TaxID=2859785 RepID=UPI001CA583E0|nr:histidine kinase dimerization/phosphoacceptor domain -containing protein [Rhizobium populisoli]MBW6426023.1 PAS domain-containing protein [Rhizobium populisoli]
MFNYATDFAAILSGMPQPYLVLGPDLHIVGASDSYLTLTSRTRDDIVGRHILQAFPENPDEAGTVEQGPLEVSLRHVLETGRPHEMAVIQYDIPRIGGGFSQKFWTPIHTPVLGDDGKVAFIIQNPMDVTESVLRNREADARLRVALHAADLASWEYEPETDTWRRSHAVDDLFGFPPGEGGPVAAPFFARMHPDDLPAVMKAMRDIAEFPDQTVINFDYRIQLPTGDTRHVSSRGEVLRSASGKVRMIGVLMDVTTDRQREADLAAALRQQELLLAEVNHRVKNSLQLVISTLRLQARRLHFPVTASAFEEAIARVQAIVSVHERLYRSGNALGVDMAAHLGKLCVDIVGDIQADRLSVHVDEMEFPPERAIPLSVIVNELLTNWLRSGSGTARLALNNVGDSEVELLFAVSGEKRSQISELGLKLITTMSAQLGGVFTGGDNGDGHVSVLRFPATEA